MMEISKGKAVCNLSPAAKHATPVVLTDMKKWMFRVWTSALWPSCSYPACLEVMLGFGSIALFFFVFFKWSLTSCETPAASLMTQWWKLLRTSEIILCRFQNTHRFLTLGLDVVSDVLTKINNTHFLIHTLRITVNSRVKRNIQQSLIYHWKMLSLDTWRLNPIFFFFKNIKHLCSTDSLPMRYGRMRPTTAALFFFVLFYDSVIQWQLTDGKASFFLLIRTHHC